MVVTFINRNIKLLRLLWLLLITSCICLIYYIRKNYIELHKIPNEHFILRISIIVFVLTGFVQFLLMYNSWFTDKNSKSFINLKKLFYYILVVMYYVIIIALYCFVIK